MTEHLMTADQFVQYVREGWNYWEESFAEHITQYQSECALFGDAGPGQGYYVHQRRAELANISARYTQLTGYHPSQHAYPIGWEEDTQCCT